MKIQRLEIPEVLLFEPQVFGDERGFFLESFNMKRFQEAIGREVSFLQDNHSRSSGGVLRGLHYQIEQAQGKLLRVVNGEIFDVAVDIRRGSPTFGKWVGAYLSAENKKQMWVPEGFAHGFLVVSDTADVLYKTTEYYASKHERCIKWDDPTLRISWPLKGLPVLSAKDSCGIELLKAEVYERQPIPRIKDVAL